MKKCLMIISALLLAGTLLLSGCTQTEYVTVTDTTTVTTTLSGYSIQLEKSVINESVRRLEAAGFWPDSVSGLVHDIGLVIGFYGEADSEAVTIVNEVIDELAPGLHLEIRENTGPLSLYSQMLMESVFHVAIARLQSAGFITDYTGLRPDPEIIAGFGYGIYGIDLWFYDKTEPEAVTIVRAAIDELAPGLPLIVKENITIVEE